MLKIRPHHLMCMQMYTGHGYDCKFVLHMNEVVSKLDEIIIQEGCDEICTHCPHKKGQCVSYEKVKRLDESVLSCCDLHYGEHVRWNEVAKKVRETIFETPMFEKICGDCGWYDLCRKTYNELR
jgi:hypothetical protein